MIRLHPALTALLAATAAGSASRATADIDIYVFDGPNEDDIPMRAGYYIGMLVAKSLSRNRSFAQLCDLRGAPLRDAIERTLKLLGIQGPRGIATDEP